MFLDYVSSVIMKQAFIFLILATMPLLNSALTEKDLKFYFTEKGEVFIESAKAHLCFRVDTLQFYEEAREAIVQWNNVSSHPEYNSPFHQSYR